MLLNSIRSFKASIVFLAMYFLYVSASVAQTPQWAAVLGSAAGNDKALVCHVSANNNVIVGGKFTNTIDLDPSAGVYNISSNGSEDMFLACYTSTGTFLWGFNAGGANIDAITEITTDAQNNVMIGGYFRGQNVDLDPSPAVNAISDVGLAGGNPPYGGDGFIAKYTSAGAYVWAIDLGGSTIYDEVESITCDNNGNVYVGGVYTNTMDLDPSANTVTINSAVDGKAFLAKYSPAGQYVWGFGYASQGVAGIDASARTILAKGNYLYVTGFYQTSGDFDPSPAVATLTGLGIYDGYVAKYDLNGNYVFAHPIHGTGLDDMFGLDLDANNNIYVCGYSNSASVTFGAVTISTPNAGSSYDIIMAKYDDNGNLLWQKTMGADKDDKAYGISISQNKMYLSGLFGSTVDFDPNAGISSLTAAGATAGDIFVASYDLNGNYLCAFRAGDAIAADEGSYLGADAQGYLYLCGQFGGAATDFDPGAATFDLSSNGQLDGMLVKYDMGSAGGGNFLLAGDTICQGMQGFLIFTSPTGPGPYTVVYTDGVNNYTVNNVSSGVPFAVTPSPTVTTTYTIVSPVAGAGTCSGPMQAASADITVLSAPVADAGPDDTICEHSGYHLSGSGGGTYAWSPAAGVDNATLANPEITAASNTVFTLIVSNGGCSDTDQVAISILPTPTANAGNDTTVCPGTVVLLHGSSNNGTAFTWTDNTGFVSHSKDTATIVVQETSFYLAVSNAIGCTGHDTIRISMVAPPDFNVTPSVNKCHGDTAVIRAGGGDVYSWTPATDISSISDSVVKVWPDTDRNYTVRITENICGRSDTFTIPIHVYPDPRASISLSEVSGCESTYLVMHAGGGTKYSWTPAALVSNATSADPTVLAETATLYTVTVTDEHGCVARDTVTARDPDDPAVYHFAPSAFTPNNDSKNDCYKILVTGPVVKYELHIYNRFGNEVFSSTDPADCWDGTYKGVTQNLGTYFYYYRMDTDVCKGIFGKGDFQLIR